MSPNGMQDPDPLKVKIDVSRYWLEQDDVPRADVEKMLGESAYRAAAALIGEEGNAGVVLEDVHEVESRHYLRRRARRKKRQLDAAGDTGWWYHVEKAKRGPFRWYVVATRGKPNTAV